MLLIIAVQVFTPCMDFLHDHPEHENTSISLEDNHLESDSHAGHEDHCSPFCTCACCGSTFLSIGESPSVQQTHPELPPIHLQSNLISNFMDRIWNPPQA